MTGSLLRRSCRGIAVFAALVAFVGTVIAADKPAAEPVGWVTQFPYVDIVPSLSELLLSTRGELLNAKALKPEDMQFIQLEIRTANNARRVAVVDMKGNMAASLFGPGSLHSLNRDEERGVESLASGDYLVAWLLKGQRVSNVVGFRIEPRPDWSKEAMVRIAQAEPRKPGNLPDFIIHVTRRTEADPALDNMSVAFANPILDGTEQKRTVFSYEGGNGPMRVGATYRGVFTLQEFNLSPDLTKPHTVAVVVRPFTLFEPKGAPLPLDASGPIREWKSAPVTLETGTPLTDAWDKASAALAPAGAVNTTVTGVVSVPERQKAQGYEVTLWDQKHSYREAVDEDGGYYFRNIPAGDYSISCNAKGKSEASVKVEKVTVVGSGARTVDLTIPSAGK